MNEQTHKYKIKINKQERMSKQPNVKERKGMQATNSICQL